MTNSGATFVCTGLASGRKTRPLIGWILTQRSGEYAYVKKRLPTASRWLPVKVAPAVKKQDGLPLRCVLCGDNDLNGCLLEEYVLLFYQKAYYVKEQTVLSSLGQNGLAS